MGEQPRQAGKVDASDRRSEPAFTLSRHITRVAGVFDAAPIGVGVWSMDGELLHPNPVLCDLLSQDRSALVGRLFESFIEPSAAADTRQLVRDLWDARRNYFECDFRCQRPDGTDWWLRTHLTPVYGPGGAPEYLVSQIFSFGLRGGREEGLAALALDAPTMLWSTDERAVPREANRATLRFLGLPEGSREVQVRLAGLLDVDDLGAARDSVADRLARREPFELVARARRADGRWRWLRHRATPRTDRTGRFLGYVGSSDDVTEQEGMRRELSHVQQLFRSITEAGPVAVLRTDRRGYVTYANGRWSELLHDPETQLRRRDWQAVLVPEHAAEVRRRAVASVRDREPFVMRVRTREPVRAIGAPSAAPADEASWGELRVAPVFDVRGQLEGFVATVTDVSAEVAARSRADRLARVLDAGTDFLLIADRVGTITHSNDAARQRLVVRSAGGPAGPSFLLEVLDADSLQLFHEQVAPVLHEHGAWRGELTLRSADGPEIVTDAHVVAERDPAGRVESFSVVARDISDQKAVQAEVQALATHDYLTGLPNRVLLYDQLESALARYQRYRTPLALLYLDLDRFKPVNDEFGHHVGDQVLRLMADRIHECTREVDTAARVGGDEFAVLIEGFADLDQVRHVCRRLLESVGRPVELPDGRHTSVGVSIGVVVANQHCAAADDLMAEGDRAMYRAKAAGRGRFEITLPGPGRARPPGGLAARPPAPPAAP